MIDGGLRSCCTSSKNVLASVAACSDNRGNEVCPSQSVSPGDVHALVPTEAHINPAPTMLAEVIRADFDITRPSTDRPTEIGKPIVPWSEAVASNCLAHSKSGSAQLTCASSTSSWISASVRIDRSAQGSGRKEMKIKEIPSSPNGSRFRCGDCPDRSLGEWPSGGSAVHS